MFLSLHACKLLHIVSQHFPVPTAEQTCNVTHARGTDHVGEHNADEKLDQISIPFNPTEENIPKLKVWLLNCFADTAFTQSNLPIMSSEKQHLHIDTDATPVATHSPLPIPHHWRNEVKQILDNYVKTGIIKCVEVGEATDWCSRMVVLTNRDQSPRITVDFTELNKHLKRETHHVPYPFHAIIDLINN